MLGKLMKYEFKATGRVFLPLFAALLIVSIVNRLLMNLNAKAPGVIGIVVAVILMVGVFVLTLILTIQRFRHNLLSNEGYLMMTLPLKTDSLILSKLFVSAVWSIASFIVVMLAIAIMAVTKDNLLSLVNAFNWVDRMALINTFQATLCMIEIVIVIVIAILSTALMLYTCMSLSMLVNKRRGLFTFGAYIAITTILQIIYAVIVAIVAALGISRTLDRMLGALGSFASSQVVIAMVVVLQLIICAVFYAITRYMLKNRLNLQ